MIYWTTSPSFVLIFQDGAGPESEWQEMNSRGRSSITRRPRDKTTTTPIQLLASGSRPGNIEYVHFTGSPEDCDTQNFLGGIITNAVDTQPTYRITFGKFQLYNLCYRSCTRVD